MRLNNSERQVVVNEIYKQVSEGIIKENDEKLAKVTLDEDSDEYLKAVKERTTLQDQIKGLQDKVTKIIELFKYRSVNGYNFDYDPLSEYSVKNYKNFIKGKIAGVKYVPTHQDIEREIILSGNKDIAELIKTIVEKLKNN